jgi:hypothetical protein
MKTIQPQEGFQWDFLASPADIVIGGGAAGVGKTFALLLDPLRDIHVKGYGGVFFRRTYPQITNQGGLWDTSKELYIHMKAKMNDSNLSWTFGNGNRIKFSHLQHEKDIYEYQGAQIPYIAFDELTHFSEKMFFYLISRNRTTCGVKPTVRATCNPDPESWVARFLEWWIDQATGFPIPDRAGVLRYFIKDGDSIVWGNTKQEVIDKCMHILDADEFKGIDKNDLVKSVTFIPGNIHQNQELLSKNPDYLSSLLAQDEATKGMLLYGNWKVKTDATSMIPHVKINDAFHAKYVPSGQRYITADIAMHGSDRFVVGYWNGLRLEDIEIYEKKTAKEIEAIIKAMAQKYEVPRSQIIYDADGIGAFLIGYLSGAKAFNNGGSPIKLNPHENFKNLKTQCYYKMAQLITDSQLYISELVQEKKILNTFVKQLIIDESRCVKRLKPDADGKLQIIPKEQMKNILGRSPDIMDMMMMRMFFELKPNLTGSYRATTTFTKQYR